MSFKGDIIRFFRKKQLKKYKTNFYVILILGTYYNIPICIWLMDTHPNNAPMCYVKPTADMDIKVSMFVDHNGKIYLPYLHDWLPVSNLYIVMSYYPLSYDIIIVVYRYYV